MNYEQVPQQAKSAINAGAAATGGLAFFKMIPWPEIAGFLSACWLLVQLGTWAHGKIRALVKKWRSKS